MLIKSDKNFLTTSSTNFINFLRANPAIAASLLLVRDGEPVRLAPIQAQTLEEWWFAKFSLLTASRGFGKAVSNSTKVMTPRGWICVCDLQVGEYVITPSGEESRITGVYPQGPVATYKIVFEDGRQCHCSKDHLWKVITTPSPLEWEIVTAEHIKLTMEDKSRGKGNVEIKIPLSEAAIYSEEDLLLPVNSYLLGSCIALEDNRTITNEFVVSKISKLVKDNYETLDFKVLNSVLAEGRIPDTYLNLNRKQTLELIRGVLDLKGKVVEDEDDDTRVKCIISNRIIAEQLQYLIRKLGGICSVSSLSFNNYKLLIQIKDNAELFSLPNSLNLFKKDNKNNGICGLKIQSIEDSIVQECTCIKIEDPDGLFIIDDFVVTHNTFLGAIYIALKCMLYPTTRIGIFAPAFRQAKFIFAEFTRLYEDSPMLQECISRPPTRLNDQCICEFKAVRQGIGQSFIKALPIGTDGSTIRGERLNGILMDEIPHIPESIFNATIQPMLSTSRNPMQRVEKIQKLSQAFGDDLPSGLLSTDNGYIGITSGFYQFNYWWKQMVANYEQMREGSSLYSLRFVPYTELPPGFFEMDVIRNAQLNSPTHMFQTEWLAEWVADSEGAFPMSLLESCRDRSIHPKTSRDLDLDKGKNYIVGVDVARENDSATIVVIEVGGISKLVHIEELQEVPFQEQAHAIFSIVERFNPLMIYMDEFGGGQTLRDLLATPEAMGWPQSKKIIDVDANIQHSGKRILKLCPPTPAFLEDINNCTKVLLEQGVVRFPSADHPIDAVKRVNAKGVIKEVDLVQELLNQIASVVITPTATGKLHYGLPTTKASASTISLDVKKKDLYSAFILACKGVYDLQWQPKVDNLMVNVGVVRELRGNSGVGGGRAGGLTFADKVDILQPRRVADSALHTKQRSIPGGGIIVTRDVRKK